MLSKATLCYLLLTLFLRQQLFAQRSTFLFRPMSAPRAWAWNLNMLRHRESTSAPAPVSWTLILIPTIPCAPNRQMREVDVNMRNAHLMFDVHPFVKSNSFAQKLLFTAGAACVLGTRGTMPWPRIKVII